jgi:DNA polymerase-1
VNIPHYETQTQEIKERVVHLREKVISSGPAKLWLEKKGRELNPGSGDQLEELFFQIMRLKPVRFTGKKRRNSDQDRGSTDEETLKALANEPRTADMARGLLEMRRLEKLIGTYINGIVRETVDGVVRPNFNLNFVSSTRSSSSSPNFQNQPEHNDNAKRIIRSGFVPRPGHKLLGVDYCGHEFRIAACVWRDRNMIAYASDPESDVHRDWGMNCYMLPRELMTGPIRSDAKNGFVFPTLFGSWWKNTGADLWGRADSLKTAEGQPLKERLMDQGLTSLDRFLSHMEGVQDRFMDQFPEFARGKRRAIRDYERKGYVDLVTGFRVYHGRGGGSMSVNNLLNTRVQGPSYHCLQWSYNRLIEHQRAEGWRTRLIGQIHDDIEIDLHPDEEDRVKPLLRKVMCEDIREHWKWIVVPLDIDAKESAVDGNWYERRVVEI